MADTRYLSAAETAKLLRQALKESFPGVKFSVRSDVYAGGASIRVRWTDGPNAKQVESVSDQFAGGYFDGMIDYAGSRYHRLDGEPVHFGANYVFANRDYSVASFDRAVRTLKCQYPGNWADAAAKVEITFEAFQNGRLYNTVFYGGSGGYNGSDSVQVVLNAQMAKQSDRLAPEASATLARLQFAGDDGYGRGTVGRDGKGGENAYKAEDEARERARAADEAAKARLAEGSPVARVSADMAAFVDPTGKLREAGLMTVEKPSVELAERIDPTGELRRAGVVSLLGRRVLQ